MDEFNVQGWPVWATRKLRHVACILNLIKLTNYIKPMLYIIKKRWTNKKPKDCVSFPSSISDM